MLKLNYKMIKKNIKLFLSKFFLLSFINNILIFLRKDNSENYKMNNFLNSILLLFNNNNITLTPFFGTLLGIYRDGGIISYDNDIDFAILDDKNKKNIIKFLLKNNFIKVLDCYIKETNQLTLEKYKYKNFEIDIFYIYEDDNSFYFFDNESNSGLSTIEEIENNIIVNPYINRISKFNIEKLHYNKLDFFAPNNIKSLLIELYGDNFMKPDKYWRQSKRNNRIKTDYELILNEY